MADIFIAYASEDRDRIKRLAAALSETGWSVFWDRVIPAGLTWRQVLAEEIKKCRCMVVAWSEASIQSEFVQEEADRGQKRGILIPMLIDHVETPLGFGAIQAADLTDWDHTNDAPEFERLTKDLSRILGPPKPAPPSQPDVPPSVHDDEEPLVDVDSAGPAPVEPDDRPEPPLIDVDDEPPAVTIGSRWAVIAVVGCVGWAIAKLAAVLVRDVAVRTFRDAGWSQRDAIQFAGGVEGGIQVLLGVAALVTAMSFLARRKWPRVSSTSATFVAWILIWPVAYLIAPIGGLRPTAIIDAINSAGTGLLAFLLIRNNADIRRVLVAFVIGWIVFRMVACAALGFGASPEHRRGDEFAWLPIGVMIAVWLLTALVMFGMRVFRNSAAKPIVLVLLAWGLSALVMNMVRPPRGDGLIAVGQAAVIGLVSVVALARALEVDSEYQRAVGEAEVWLGPDL